MAEKVKTFVLDSYALFAHFQAESAGPDVQELLENARDNQAIRLIGWQPPSFDGTTCRGGQSCKDIRIFVAGN